MLEELFEAHARLLAASVQSALSEPDWEDLCEYTVTRKLDEVEIAQLNLQLLAGATSVHALRTIAVLERHPLHVVTP